MCICNSSLAEFVFILAATTFWWAEFLVVCIILPTVTLAMLCYSNLTVALIIHGLRLILWNHMFEI